MIIHFRNARWFRYVYPAQTPVPLVPVIIGVEEAQHLTAHTIFSESFFIPSVPVACVLAAQMLWYPLFTTFL